MIWIVLLTFGLSGLLSGFNNSGYYAKRDYFQTVQFQDDYHRFLDLLSGFELSELTAEKAKKLITVTNAEIDEHRYRYGDLSAQVSNIKEQYEDKIQQALASNNEEVAQIYMAERDQKIEDITNNFKSDDHVRAKIIKEKEAHIDEYFTFLERQKEEFLQYKNTFKYYLKNTKTGKVYSNLEAIQFDSNTSDKIKNSLVEDQINKGNMAFIRDYSNHDLLSTEGRYPIGYDDIMLPIINGSVEKYEGQIAIPKVAPQGRTELQNYYNYQKEQLVFYIHVITGLAALAICLLIYKKTNWIRAISFEKWQRYYMRVPIDVKIVVFLVSCLAALLALTSSHYIYYDYYFYNKLDDMVIYLGGGAIFVALSLVLGKMVVTRLLDSKNVKADFQKSLAWRIVGALQSAFLNRRVGTQMIILLAVIFGCGIGAVIVLLDPVFLIIYVPVLLVIGIPVFILLMKRIGYFNQIVHNTSELAQGNYEPDLPINGKSILAKLAENINTLKYGVKVSQKAQAKSERLKTELITNVSHDLRTPLTSIITYTELLKTPDLTDEDRNSYIEIIDRKSKRLKVLIDDLFEASKMASGNMELVKEKVDLVQLLQQTLAEHDEALSESSLQLRITKPDTPLYAHVDGQKLWRVFDNLIGNILKYSLENTRVYISMKPSARKVEIEFKNVAKYELGGDIDELFERFKRGDTSRHTEGSGLGLAIAKSIVDLHEGNLDIYVDGDLFKVVITLDLM